MITTIEIIKNKLKLLEIVDCGAFLNFNHSILLKISKDLVIVKSLSWA